MIWRLASWRALPIIGASALVCAIIVFVVVAPSPPFPPKGYGKDLPPARLLGDFYSYSTVETVRSKVQARGLQWNVLEEPTSPRSRAKPFYIAKVPNFSHLGVTGDLSFFFVRDRLMRIQFVPPDPRAYWDALVRAEQIQGVRSRANGEVVWAKLGDVEVWLSVLFPDARFVGWRDERLQDEVNYDYD